MARRAKAGGGARERLLEAAYQLFSTHGVERVGIDAILARSGCAKASLYNHFKSKDELVIAFLERRELLWTRGWLEVEVKRRAAEPEARLIAIFDVLDGWFRKRDFEGCSFVNALVEARAGESIHAAASAHLAKVRDMIGAFAIEAGLEHPREFARALHILMVGAVVAAGEGNRNAARDARRIAVPVIAAWPRARRGQKPAKR